MNSGLKCVLIYSGISFLIALLLINVSTFNDQNGGGPTTTLSHTNDRTSAYANCPENFFDVRSIGVLSDGAWQATVTTSSPWLHLLSPATGYGDGFVDYQVERNLTSFVRVAIIEIGEQELHIVQDAYDESVPCPTEISRSSFRTSSGGGATEFSLNDRGRNLDWRADVKENIWMEFNPVQGNGSGSTTLLVKPNSSASARMGTVEIAGKKIPIIQGGDAEE